MPDNLGFCFPTAKFRSGQGPEFGEVELIAFPFVIKGCQKLAVQRQMANLRTASADVEHAVSKFFPSDDAGEVVGGEPDPRTGIFLSIHKSQLMLPLPHIHSGWSLAFSTKTLPRVWVSLKKQSPASTQNGLLTSQCRITGDFLLSNASLLVLLCHSNHKQNLINYYNIIPIDCVPGKMLYIIFRCNLLRLKSAYIGEGTL